MYTSKLIVLFWGFLFLPLVIIASDTMDEELVSKLFTEAGQLYSQQSYSQALQKYLEIINHDFESGEIWFNAGNAAFKSGDLVSAIIYYERAKKFMPSDEDLKKNLAIANLQVIDKIQPIPKIFILRWYETVISFFSADSAVKAAFMISLLTMVLFLFQKLTRSAIVRTLTTLTAIASLTALMIFSACAYRENNLNFGIINTEKVDVLSAPAQNEEAQFVLHKGLKVQIMRKVQDWVEVRLPDGKKGWLQNNSLIII